MAISLPLTVGSEKDASLFRSAEALVSRSLGKPVTFTSIHRLTGPDGNKTLYRCTSAAGSEPPVSCIIKKASAAPFPGADPHAWEVSGFANDWAGAEFLSSLQPGYPVSPGFYGGDFEQGFFVQEDLGEHHSLVDPLLRGDAASAEAGLMKYAACLGALHAGTVGKAGLFETMYSARFPGLSPFADELHELDMRLGKVATLLDLLGVPASSTLAGEIKVVVEAAISPGPFLAYIHTDPCPDNLFDLGGRYRLIDFEYGHFGHALLDATYPRMVWPSCWCAGRLPDEVIARLENAYRAELCQGCTAAQEDEVWETALVNMCGMTLINRIGWDLEEALPGDRKRGLATIRQRMLAELEAFITAAEAFDRLPALRGAASRLLALLQAWWSDTRPLPMFPAFGG